jgi:hypothetical protein
VCVVVSLVLALTVLLDVTPEKASASTNGGSSEWVKRLAGAGGAYNQTGGMVTSANGSTVFLAASSGGELVTIAYAATTGARQWKTRTVDPAGGQLVARAVAASADGTRLLVTADDEIDPNTHQAVTVAFDASTGVQLWLARVDPGPGSEAIPRRIAVSADGGVFVAGSRTGTHGSDDFWDYFVVKYAAATGVKSWQRRFDGPTHHGDTAEGLVVTSSLDRVVVTGTSLLSGSNRDIVTVGWRASDGTLVWTQRIDSGADDFATDAVLSPDGRRVYVSGYGRPSFNVGHAFEVASFATSTGGPLGRLTVDDGGDDFSTDLALSADGSTLAVTGGSFNGGNYLTAALPASLDAVTWTAAYNGGHGADDANAVALDATGANVFVTGESQTGSIACYGDVGAATFATVAYAGGTGLLRWVARYGGLKQAPDAGLAAAASADGSRVVVAGDSDFDCGSSEVATVSYENGP